ncbi:hypothetical protein QJS04_geneDACA004823 [Acorus gramineus]|uniref:Pectinesterase n=1 Tax=Acorus gramineus TaxID=55184 RepID=A0AAV9BVG8_ACOGR|nr:hypothetical protein QJS04_geneDACA004823 [Acorus gramineus]
MKKNKHNKLLLIFLSTALILAITIAIATSAIATHKHKKSSSSASRSASHAILRQSCSSTRFPDLCISSISTSPDNGVMDRITSQKDVIEASLNLTKLAVQRSFTGVQKIIHTRANLTVREKTALHDCLEMFDETLDELRLTEKDLQAYPAKKSLSEQAEDLKILVGAAMTNQETCLDGFSHDEVCRHLRQTISGGVTHVGRMCSNALAMIKNLTDSDIATAMTTGSGNRRRLLWSSTEGDGSFPMWMSAADRKLLQAPSGEVKANAVVAADGSGNYKTVSAAVAAAPEKGSGRYVIKIKAGTYKENVEVGKKKTKLMFIGDGMGKTIITGSRNVVDGSTTFQSATVAVVGGGFLARDLTFQNTAGPSKHQAVALRVGSDLAAFYRCEMSAYQDTLYVHSLRQFFRDCRITGTVDFIFGNSAVVFQSCDILARRPNAGQKNMVTAQGRDDPNEVTGISIQNCRISADGSLEPVKKSFKTFLGRPWKEYSRTVVMKSVISDVIDPAGWHEWNGNFALNTLYYAEYMNTGAGSGTAGRVTWKGYRVLTNAAEAGKFTAGNFISGGSWLAGTGFPFSLGL